LKGRGFSRAAKSALLSPVIPTRERSPSGVILSKPLLRSEGPGRATPSAVFLTAQ
jgi:hypothetical protein